MRFLYTLRHQSSVLETHSRPQLTSAHKSLLNVRRLAPSKYQLNSTSFQLSANWPQFPSISIHETSPTHILTHASFLYIQSCRNGSPAPPKQDFIYTVLAHPSIHPSLLPPILHVASKCPSWFAIPLQSVVQHHVARYRGFLGCHVPCQIYAGAWNFVLLALAISSANWNKLKDWYFELNQPRCCPWLPDSPRDTYHWRCHVWPEARGGSQPGDIELIELISYAIKKNKSWTTLAIFIISRGIRIRPRNHCNHKIVGLF